MRRHVPNCPGSYEERRIDHTIRYQGRLMVIEGVPAEVCDFCGDTLVTPETSRALDHLLRQPPAPAGTIPLYRYPGGAAGAPVTVNEIEVGAPES